MPYFLHAIINFLTNRMISLIACLIFIQQNPKNTNNNIKSDKISVSLSLFSNPILLLDHNNQYQLPSSCTRSVNDAQIISRHIRVTHALGCAYSDGTIYVRRTIKKSKRINKRNSQSNNITFKCYALWSVNNAQTCCTIPEALMSSDMFIQIVSFMPEAQ